MAAFAALLMVFCATEPASADPLGAITNFPPISLGSLSTTNLQGDTNLTDFYPWDIKIAGAGFFLVRDPVDNSFSATRFGAFNLDTNGFLVTTFGKRLQGFMGEGSTNLVDLAITNAIWQRGSFGLESFQIQSNGFVVETISNTLSIVLGQVALQNFQNPSALVTQGWRFFSWSSAAVPFPQAVLPGTSGTGWLVSGAVEQIKPKLQINPYAGPPQSFAQGVLIPTPVPTDVGIEGHGFFVLRRTNDNALFATRAGAFYIDGTGYFVHYSGMRLEGYNDSTQSSVGDVQINPVGSVPDGNPSALVTDFGIDLRGVVMEYLTDGSSIARGQILLEECSNPNAAARTNFDLYPIIANSGLWSPMAPAMTENLGWLVAGTLEASQFDMNLIGVRNRLNFFSQGYITGTGTPSDLAIEGPGFFTIRDPATAVLYATRCGAFQTDTLGYLVTSNGLRAQGFTNELGTQLGDIVIPPASVSYTTDTEGNIAATFPDGTSLSCGTVLVQQFRNLQGLVSIGNLLYSNLTEAIPMVTNSDMPNPLSYIQSEAIEEPAPPPPAIQLLPPAGGFHLFISDLMMGTLESSTDLVHWNAIGQVEGSPDLNVGEFFDTPQSTQTFYRVVVPLGGGN
jgi:flagellar hook protein FlgE